MTTNADTSRPAVPVSARAEALRGLVDAYHRALVGSQSHTPVTSYGGYPERVAAARARLDAELAALVQDAERLKLAEYVLGNFRNAHCLTALLGEDTQGCECMGCASRAYFVARAATPTGGSDAR